MFCQVVVFRGITSDFFPLLRKGIDILWSLLNTTGGHRRMRTGVHLAHLWWVALCSFMSQNQSWIAQVPNSFLVAVAVIGNSVFSGMREDLSSEWKLVVCQELDCLFITFPQAAKNMVYFHVFAFGVQYYFIREFCTLHCWLGKADVCCYW